jgi:Zn-dependent M28 family amino/carboxypeptidase
MRRTTIKPVFALILIAGITFVVNCGGRGGVPKPARLAMDGISPDRIKAHIKFLSDDLLEGRGTGTRGDDIASLYIASQFAMAGVKPAVSGSYFQTVPLVGITTEVGSSLRFTRGSRVFTPRVVDEYVMWTEKEKPRQNISGNLVFVGYGIVAPEYDWDDYKGVDVKGKILLMLVNDPPSDDPAFFGGKALTYYGRWTYKFEIAEKKRALGVILIHTTPTATYGWSVVKNSWSREQTFVSRPENPNLLALEGWITKPMTEKLLAACGYTLDELMSKAEKRDFKPINLGVNVSANIKSKIRSIKTNNVIGIVEGSDPELKEEAVIYTAHHDHLGIGPTVNGDNLYNGAVDNASGVAIILDIARVVAASKEKPKRSFIFFATACEEGGLLGSSYYAANPIVPPGKTAADINIDAVSVWGETADYTFLGLEKTTLEPIVERIAKQLDFGIAPDSRPEAGRYYRSDHFPLAKVGIPALNFNNGPTFIGEKAEWAKRMREEYGEKHYHNPSDEFSPDWDLSGAAQLARVGLLLGWKVANMPELLSFKEGDEFYQVRQDSFKAVKK